MFKMSWLKARMPPNDGAGGLLSWTFFEDENRLKASKSMEYDTNS